MGSMARPALCVFVTLLVLATAVQAAQFDGYDGMPRPPGMDQNPTTPYGAKPAVTYLNKPAKCMWYGWENGNYPPEGTQNCSKLLWASLSNANPADLQGFLYYAPQDSIFFDAVYNEYLCAIGCFDLSASSGPASPPSGNPAVTPAMPPSSDATPPPTSDATPPPTSAATPPPGSSIVPPPPATLFRPPPPAMPIAPASIPVASQPTLPPTTTVAPAKPPSPTAATVPTLPSPGPGAAQVPGPSPSQTGAASMTSASILLLLASILISFLV